MTKARDFIEEVAKCQTHSSSSTRQKKAQPRRGCAKFHQRRRVEETFGTPGLLTMAFTMCVLCAGNWCGARYFAATRHRRPLSEVKVSLFTNGFNRLSLVVLRPPSPCGLL